MKSADETNRTRAPQRTGQRSTPMASDAAGTPSRGRRIVKTICIMAAACLLLTAYPDARAQDGAGATGGGGGEAAAAGEAAGGGGGEEGAFDPTAVGSRDRIKAVRAAGAVRTRTPQVHTVKRGDTLWDITRYYFKNPYLWPALWSYNPHITNPHWIYPDDLVFLRPAPGSAGAGALGGDRTGAGAGDGGGQSARDLLGFAGESGIMVQSAGYYTDEELQGAGRIVFSPEEKSMLTIHDEAYLDWEDIEMRKQVPSGTRFAIYHPMDSVVDPETDEEIALKLKLVGTLRVVFNDGLSLPTALVTDAMQEIERGDVILPAGDALFRLESRANDAETNGRIIDTFDIITQLGEQQFVLLNRGTDHGVQRGNRFLVFEQREGLIQLPPPEKEQRPAGTEAEKEDDDDDDEAKDDRKYVRPGDRDWPCGEQPASPPYPDDDCDGPPECEDDEDEDDDDDDEDDRPCINEFRDDREYDEGDLPLRHIGELIVVKANERFATGLILDSRREFNIGQRITLLSGY